MISVRKSTLSDIQIISQYQIKMAFETEAIQLNPIVVSNGVNHLFKHPEDGWYWIAEKDNSVVGCCMTLREWSDWRNGYVLWLHSVYVLPEFRNEGVFRTMYEYLKDLVLKNDKLKGIRLYVDKSNSKAMSTYRSVGMNGEHYQLFEWMK